MGTPSNQLKKVLWALDPFDSDQKLNNSIGEAIGRLIGDRPVEVEVVYLFSHGVMALSTGNFKEEIKNYHLAAEKAVNSALSKLQLSFKPKVHVVSTHSESSAELCQELSDFAQAEGANLIALGTHAREGMDHFFLGSFVETLMITSKVPVYTINPEEAHDEPIQHILFPSDFSDESKKAFAQVLDLAQSIGANIQLLHKFVLPAEPVIQTGALFFGGSYLPLDKYRMKIEERIQKDSQEFLALAKEKSVAIDFTLDHDSANVTTSIVDYAKKHKNCMIAMASQSGELASVLVGSVARQVVRRSTRPVWIVHSS